MKYFDLWQRIITIVGVASFALSVVFLVWNSASATPVYNESGAIVEFKYQVLPQTLFSIFTFLNILCLIWFVARSITYKMRIKEALDENKGY